jgi:nucleoside-diphosphate-sugar epimerase
MRVLITGANGFIGSYLANYFLQKGYEVIATSRQFHSSTRTLLKNARLFDLDVLNTGQLQNLSLQADMIVHTATANDIISRDGIKGIELSAIGTKNILEFGAKNGIQKCIVFSTLQVYGTELTGEVSESSPLHFQNDYGINHLFAEMYAEMYSRQGKVQCVSVRPSNVYGRILSDAFNRWSLVPGCFCKEAVDSGTITIRSSGKQMRNFVNLENLSRAIECIMQQFPDQYESYNLASSQGFTMLKVAEITKQVFEKEFQKSLEIQITGAEPVNTNFFNLNIDKLKAVGFTEDEKFTLESEITEIFSYLKSKK